jgi:hypothetical protein
MCCSRHGEGGPMVNAAGLPAHVINASIRTERLTAEG